MTSRGFLTAFHVAGLIINGMCAIVSAREGSLGWFIASCFLVSLSVWSLTTGRQVWDL